jgi:hypothetical protein
MRSAGRNPIEIRCWRWGIRAWRLCRKSRIKCRIPGWLGGLASITLVLAVFEEKMGWFEKIAVGPAWVYGAACAVLLLSVELMGFAGPAVPFVYFQF